MLAWISSAPRCREVYKPVCLSPVENGQDGNGEFPNVLFILQMFSWYGSHRVPKYFFFLRTYQTQLLKLKMVRVGCLLVEAGGIDCETLYLPNASGCSGCFPLNPTKMDISHKISKKILFGVVSHQFWCFLVLCQLLVSKHRCTARMLFPQFMQRINSIHDWFCVFIFCGDHCFCWKKFLHDNKMQKHKLEMLSFASGC